jgi:hypothetical protein
MGMFDPKSETSENNREVGTSKRDFNEKIHGQIDDDPEKTEEVEEGKKGGSGAL